MFHYNRLLCDGPGDGMHYTDAPNSDTYYMPPLSCANPVIFTTKSPFNFHNWYDLDKSFMHNMIPVPIMGKQINVCHYCMKIVFSELIEQGVSFEQTCRLNRIIKLSNEFVIKRDELMEELKMAKL